MSGPGTPDLNCCLNGVDVWIELKVIVGTKKLRFQKSLSVGQRNWLVMRSKAGGRAFLLARHEQHILLWNGKTLIHAAPDEVLEKLPPDYRLPLEAADDLLRILFG